MTKSFFAASTALLVSIFTANLTFSQGETNSSSATPVYEGEKTKVIEGEPYKIENKEEKKSDNDYQLKTNTDDPFRIILRNPESPKEETYKEDTPRKEGDTGYESGPFKIEYKGDRERYPEGSTDEHYYKTKYKHDNGKHKGWYKQKHKKKHREKDEDNND